MSGPENTPPPARLRVVGASGLERRTLDAAARELPSVELTEKMRRSLGLSIATGAIATGVAAKSSAAPATIGGTSAIVWPAISVGVLALALTGAVVGVRATGARSAGPPPATTPAPAPRLAPPPVAAAQPAAASTIARALRPPHRRSALPATSPDLRAEIALVDAARGAVAAGACARALTLLDRYEADYRHGTFRPEVAALRVEALDHLGRTEQARALAQRFIASHPDSPLSARIALLTGPAR